MENSLPDNSPPGTFALDHCPHEKYTWRQRCLALREICRLCEPIPTRSQVLNPNASEASYKPEQRRGGTFLEGIYRGGTFRGGGAYLEPM